MRRFDADAVPLGPAVPVNTYTTGKQRLPRVAADSAGNYVVTWTSQDQDGSGLGVYAQRFDNTGAPVGGEFAVNTSTTGDQDRPAVDMDDTGFTIAFMDGAGGVVAREFSGPAIAEGTPQFPVFGPNHRLPDVARLDGAHNTLYLAENTDTQGIDGIRTVDGVAQTSFPAFPHGFGPQLARSSLRTFPIAEGGTEAARRAWAAYWDEVGCYGQEYEVAASGAVDERHDLILMVQGGQIVEVGAGRTGGAVFAAQTSDAAADVKQAFAGDPQADVLGIALDNNNNGVLDPDETVSLRPGLTNLGAAALFLTGSIVVPVGSLVEGGALTVDDDTASWGSIPAGGSGDCSATGDCYQVTVSGARPAPHWDEKIVETLSTDVHKEWRLHIGGSFADVPDTSLFYPFVENLFHNGITAGGSCGGYCPTDGVKRQQMAVFLLKSRFGASFTPPPATGTIFADVPLSNPFAAWIEALYLLNVTGGCATNPLQYCPDAIVNRQQMAVFLLKTKEGSTYDPPDCAGIFTDVPCTPGAGFSDWIEELYNRQITGGCVANPLQYCPTNPTNRQQMAAFLVKNFELLLYGP
jgi:hypothetical protein